MNRLNLLSLISGIGLYFISVLVSAAPSGENIARQGNGKGALACMSCHGEQGQGNAAAGYPHLAGLPVEYIKKQLHDFQQKSRKSPVMQPFANALSEDEIRAVAGYYAKLSPPTKTMAVNNKQTQLAKGEHLAKNGKWESGMPACFQCHGNKGQGIPPHFPPISGQPASYIKQQLEHWQKGQRKNDPIGLMQSVATHLDDADITAVAGYLASLSPATAK